MSALTPRNWLCVKDLGRARPLAGIDLEGSEFALGRGGRTPTGPGHVGAPAKGAGPTDGVSVNGIAGPPPEKELDREAYELLETMEPFEPYTDDGADRGSGKKSVPPLENRGTNDGGGGFPYGGLVTSW